MVLLISLHGHHHWSPGQKISKLHLGYFVWYTYIYIYICLVLIIDHYSDIHMTILVSEVTCHSTVCSTACSGWQKNQSSTKWIAITDNVSGLLPDGSKPLPEPMLTSPQWSSVAFNWDQLHSKCSRYYSLRMALKIMLLKLLPHLPGANELTHLHLVLHICASQSGQHWLR